jgi:hypothetical protein
VIESDPARDHRFERFPEMLVVHLKGYYYDYSVDTKDLSEAVLNLMHLVTGREFFPASQPFRFYLGKRLKSLARIEITGGL